MTTTRVFKSGNSQAVRIPKEFAFEREGVELEISRDGDALVLRPVRKGSMAELVEYLRANPMPLMVEALERPMPRGTRWDPPESE